MKLALLTAASVAALAIGADNASAQPQVLVPHRNHYHTVPAYQPQVAIPHHNHLAPAYSPPVYSGYGYLSSPGVNFGGYSSPAIVGGYSNGYTPYSNGFSGYGTFRGYSSPYHHHR